MSENGAVLLVNLFRSVPEVPKHAVPEIPIILPLKSRLSVPKVPNRCSIRSLMSR